MTIPYHIRNHADVKPRELVTDLGSGNSFTKQSYISLLEVKGRVVRTPSIYGSDVCIKYVAFQPWMHKFMNIDTDSVARTPENPRYSYRQHQRTFGRPAVNRRYSYRQHQRTLSYRLGPTCCK